MTKWEYDPSAFVSNQPHPWEQSQSSPYAPSDSRLAEQMRVDPISKLAAAIHDLADATRELAKTQAKSGT